MLAARASSNALMAEWLWNWFQARMEPNVPSSNTPVAQNVDSNLRKRCFRLVSLMMNGPSLPRDHYLNTGYYLKISIY
jgi:hypothetical protein